MKINWGTGVVLAFIGFISFILFFVFKMNMDNRSNHDLVTEDYYKDALNHQTEINAQVNANNADKILIEKTAEGLLLIFPETIDLKELEGTVSLYRPSNKQLDFDLPISLSNTHLLIPDKRLLDGRWDIKINWKINEDSYLQKERITY
ncbi:cytochrome C oxidase Cbb3 [Maribacter sp. 4U21]|jgi:nitrogen fixation protein FixH|uniref:FixH family protein n=1 Tax=Maribacter sp. 4U21 TaxID=1889779 RepID=UPI000C15356A|nr:FixH family protein [Maribacter sp. 4U21]PIB27364.1 cytochrome C oxidase Cbb3 [Maribacter sp. 4U21]